MKINDSFMVLWGGIMIAAVLVIIVVSVPLLTHPERPWLGLNPPAPVVSSTAAVGSVSK